MKSAPCGREGSQLPAGVKSAPRGREGSQLPTGRKSAPRGREAGCPLTVPVLVVLLFLVGVLSRRQSHRHEVPRLRSCSASPRRRRRQRLPLQLRRRFPGDDRLRRRFPSDDRLRSRFPGDDRLRKRFPSDGRFGRRFASRRVSRRFRGSNGGRRGRRAVSRGQHRITGGGRRETLLQLSDGETRGIVKAFKWFCLI